MPNNPVDTAGSAYTSANMTIGGTLTVTGSATLLGGQTVTGGVTSSIGNIVALAGNVVAGSSGNAGTVTSFPSTASKGNLVLAAVNNTGNTVTTISNSAMGQASILFIPDPGASTANFLLDAGANNILSVQEFIGLTNIINIATGTWTTTRIAEGNYVKRHTANSETSIIGLDITPAIRTAASKGLQLNSFDVIYNIGTLAMNAHTVTLDQISYANNTAVLITSVPLTGSLSTATQSAPYVTNIAITTPGYANTTDSKYVIEITTNNAATTAYDFYGVVLKFSQTIA